MALSPLTQQEIAIAAIAAATTRSSLFPAILQQLSAASDYQVTYDSHHTFGM